MCDSKTPTVVTTVDKQTWLNSLLEQDDSSPVYQGHVVDIQTSRWFADNVCVAGYMCEPVAICAIGGENVEIAAKTVLVRDFKDFLERISPELDRLYLYSILFVPNMPKCYDLDMQTFKQTPLKHPVVNTDLGCWKVRFAIANKENN
jgi:hypothetical protein